MGNRQNNNSRNFGNQCGSPQQNAYYRQGNSCGTSTSQPQYQQSTSSCQPSYSNSRSVAQISMPSFTQNDKLHVDRNTLIVDKDFINKCITVNEKTGEVAFGISTSATNTNLKFNTVENDGKRWDCSEQSMNLNSVTKIGNETFKYQINNKVDPANPNTRVIQAILREGVDVMRLEINGKTYIIDRKEILAQKRAEKDQAVVELKVTQGASSPEKLEPTIKNEPKVEKKKELKAEVAVSVDVDPKLIPKRSENAAISASSNDDVSLSASPGAQSSNTLSVSSGSQSQAQLTPFSSTPAPKLTAESSDSSVLSAAAAGSQEGATIQATKTSATNLNASAEAQTLYNSLHLKNTRKKSVYISSEKMVDTLIAMSEPKLTGVNDAYKTKSGGVSIFADLIKTRDNISTHNIGQLADLAVKCDPQDKQFANGVAVKLYDSLASWGKIFGDDEVLYTSLIRSVKDHEPLFNAVKNEFKGYAEESLASFTKSQQGWKTEDDKKMLRSIGLLETPLEF